ncbi:MAG TPA: site-specific integrase [Stellaceae bacterium]|nr:site-specific integrase [Stellaceae bacterium]
MPRAPEGPRLRPNPKRGGVFYIYWTDERTGRSRERSTGTRDSAQAHQIFADWIDGRDAPPRWDGPRRASQASIADVLAIYADGHAEQLVENGRKTLGYAIVALLKWWGGRTCDYVKPETCQAYARDRKAEIEAQRERGSRKSASRPASSGTAARELSVLSAALGYAHKNGKLLDRPFVELPAKGQGRDRWLARAEAAALLWESRRDPQARGHLPLFILLALATGARPAALFDLRWTQIDFDRDRINLNPAGRRQTAKRRPVIPMPRRLRWFLLRAHARASSPYVLSYRGQKLASVKRAFARARERAGLGPEVIPYTLRHTAGTWLAHAGVDLWLIGGWLGHSQARTTELYAHHSPNHLTAARKVMD